MAGLQHSLALNKDLNQRARERFTSSMRAWVLTDLAAQMQADYEQASIDVGESHDSGEAVHQFLKERGLFKWYSTLRCATQELVWQSVLRAIESDPDSVKSISATTSPKHGGSLALDENVALPAYIDTMDVHLMPGKAADTAAVISSGKLIWSRWFFMKRLPCELIFNALAVIAKVLSYPYIIIADSQSR